jgi:hypothetical protein
MKEKLKNTKFTDVEMIFTIIVHIFFLFTFMKNKRVKIISTLYKVFTLIMQDTLLYCVYKKGSKKKKKKNRMAPPPLPPSFIVEVWGVILSTSR